MSGVELALAIPGAVDVALRYGKSLIDTYTAIVNAETEISELILRAAACWTRTSSQLEFLSRIWSDLNENHQQIQEQIINVLISKLTAARLKINGLLRPKSTVHQQGTDPQTHSQPLQGVKRFKYAAFKASLLKSIEDLEQWQRQFDPSWFLMMRVASPRVDEELSKSQHENRAISAAQKIRDSLKTNSGTSGSVFLPANGLEGSAFHPIPFTRVQLVSLGSAVPGLTLIVEPLPADGRFKISQRRKIVRDLAQKLMKANPATLAMLECVGVIQDPAASKAPFTLVFKQPQSMSEPQTLRAIILQKNLVHSLSDRFQIATQLAQSVCSVHTLGFVHKSIRPENILLFQDKRSTLGSAFLLGFDMVRRDEGATQFLGDSDWEKNLYRHPQRQGVKIFDPYVMQHDIYSLGVCLLEIGLWESFIEYSSPIAIPTRSSTYTFNDNQSQDSESIKNKMLQLSKTTLPSKMGTCYANIVETCLTCLDDGNEGMGDESEFLDEDGVLVAVRYIEKVLMQFGDILV